MLKVLILDHEILDINMTESHGMASSQSLESKDRSKILTDPGNYPCPIEELPFAHVHAAASASGLDTYVDPSTGLLVMTSLFLSRRKTGCCGNSCRHCPFNHVNVKIKWKKGQEVVLGKSVRGNLLQIPFVKHDIPSIAIRLIIFIVINPLPIYWILHYDFCYLYWTWCWKFYLLFT